MMRAGKTVVFVASNPPLHFSRPILLTLLALFCLLTAYAVYRAKGGKSPRRRILRWLRRRRQSN